ncbi:MAG TPA: protein kinase [Myxococcales bacterium]|nr:protein kinase [Myxococcales bacterium]
MDAKAREKLLEQARKLSPRDAGQLLLESLGAGAAQVGRLDADGRKVALMAAIYLGRAGENETAVQLLVALGEQQRAVELLQKAGDTVGAARVASMKPGQFDTGPLLTPPKVAAVGGAAVSAISAHKLEEQGKLEAALQAYVQLKRFGDAARVAASLGRHDDAAQLHADAGQPFEAAEAYLAAGDTGKALENLCRVQRDDERYRTAAAQAVRLATNLGVLDFRLENFLGVLVQSGPRDADEVQVFDLLAQLYEAHGFPENAREALQKILTVDPRFPGARERVAGLDKELRPSAMVARQVLSNADLHKRDLPQLDLSDLPDLEDNAASATLLTAMPPRPAQQKTLAEDVLQEAEAVPEPGRAGGDGKFEVGGTIAARYRLEAKIGQGGMASVFRAFDLELEEKVALKVFNVAQTSEVALSRFKMELKLSRQLIHPNIIRLFDIGAHQGHRYISMELLIGKSLKERMAKPIEFRTAIGYLMQACHGLQVAHDAGVVHRDVKPDNFFVTDDGVLKVMDFGIARQQSAPGVTVAGSIAGTPMYMSPEQISSFSTVTHLTDLYALGVCAYELFTGRVPFFHADLVPMLMMHVNDAPVPPRTHAPQMPLELERVILQLLEKDPARRYQSCRELAAALQLIRDKYA